MERKQLMQQVELLKAQRAVLVQQKDQLEAGIMAINAEIKKLNVEMTAKKEPAGS